MAGKRQFREHVGISSGAECPRQDQIEDRRAFIASLGGVLVGAMLGQGCGDDEKPAGPEDSGGVSPHIDAARDKSPYPVDSGGHPDMPKAPKDAGPPPPDLPGGPPDVGAPIDYGSGGLPDTLKAPKDMPSGTPDMPVSPKDMKPPQKEMTIAGLPPMPDK